ncbi:hypothetical protein BKA70DRAFT_1240255 [Coprinopsis sp. MPI-PUGE-AT-0042]|nr:hypothetical protein BKA70DRAFT_1240255 [Coprinopsis sp. MPI-PUGE-AT-0042]
MNYSGYSCRECGSTYSTARHLNSHEKERCVRSKRSLEDLLGQTKSSVGGTKAAKDRQLDKPYYPPAPRYPPPPSAASITNSDRDAKMNHLMAVEDEPPMAVEGEPLVQAALHNAPIAIRRTRRARKLPARFADNADPGSDNEEDEHPERLLPLDADSGPTPSAVACSSAITGTCPPMLGGGGLQSPIDSHYGAATMVYNFPHMTLKDIQTSMVQMKAQTTRPLPRALRYQHLGPSQPQRILVRRLVVEWRQREVEHELQKLLTLVTTEGFSFEDAFATDWKATIKVLDADEDEDDNDEDNSWFDDANWILTPITIPVSFHRLMKNSVRNIKPWGI